MSSFFYTSVGPEFFNKRLSEAFEFNFPDLAKNREGELAPSQLDKLIWTAVLPLMRTIVGCMLLLGAYVGLAKYIGQGTWVQVVQFLVLFTIAAGMVKASINIAMLIGDFTKGKVAMIEGRMEPSWNMDGRRAVNQRDTGSRSVTKYRFAVGPERFDVPESAFRILTDNFEAGLPTVRVYYTPSSKQILSIEAISIEELALRPEQTKKKTKVTSIWKSKLES
ncbi:hypothetical protein F183_A49840 [Bryobacterales bacterium F-183]|nr:hypothetical protein F183_A49840 [Bryobacterales bacterium F-183]